MDELPLRPVASDWDWQLSAACRGLDAMMFFHPENERGSRRRRREERAKDVCAHCTVRAACLEWAITAAEPYGVWGGLSPADRDQLHQARIQAETISYRGVQIDRV